MPRSNPNPQRGIWRKTVEDHLSRVDYRLAILEGGRRKPTFETPGGGRPPTRPPPEIPGRREVTIDYQLKTGPPETDGFGASDTDDIRFRAGPFNVRVVWDQFHEDMGPKHTLFLTNPFRGTGVVRWKNLTVTVDGIEYNMRQPGVEGARGKRGTMVPKGCIIRSAIEPEDWNYIDETADLPQWIRVRALGEIESRTAHWVGPYHFWRNDTEKDASGGDGVAHHHGGADDWLATCWEGMAHRWAEACGSMSRALWMMADDGTPMNLADTSEHYWDGSSVELAPTGYKWTYSPDGWCEYETILAKRPPADVSHGRRWYGAVYALAKHCKAARVMADCCWNEIKNKYSMDPRVPVTTNPDSVLFSPLHQILELISPGWPQEPPNGGNWGSRMDAHAINIVAEHLPYMNREDLGIYPQAWREFLDLKVDTFGRADFSYTGDAASSSGLPATACMHFQQALLCGAARNIDMGEIADLIAQWWGTSPPYYAHTQGDYRTATAAPHSGAAVVDYTMVTHPGTWAGYGSFAGVVEKAKHFGLGETPLDCVPPEDRDWESVA